MDLYMLMSAQSAINQNISLLLKENYNTTSIESANGLQKMALNSQKLKQNASTSVTNENCTTIQHLISKKKISHLSTSINISDLYLTKTELHSHINYIKTKCNKALQLLCIIAHTNWGADKNSLLKLYQSWIQSKIDYSCFIYQSAKKPYLKSLNPIYNIGLRLALGDFKTIPVESLYAEANKTPPKLRCNNLALKYYTKLHFFVHSSSS